MSDLTMLRRELVIGYTVAGFLAVLVPTSVWQAVFITGHGFWTTVENAIVGPFIAIISFVCSIGNVPLAAALWSGGISFGGVIAFIFADLIAFPLLLIYRRYYGTRLMLRMLAVFWALMSTAGLLTELLFRAAGLVPTMRPTTIAPAHFSWNYTTYLNLIFLVLFGVLYWLYRNRERLGAGDRYARDPVCGMQVEKAHAPASRQHAGERQYFCSDHCAERFDARVATGHANRARATALDHTRLADRRTACTRPAAFGAPADFGAEGPVGQSIRGIDRSGRGVSRSGESVDLALALDLGADLPHLPFVFGDLGIEGVAVGRGFLLRRRWPVGGVGGGGLQQLLDLRRLVHLCVRGARLGARILRSWSLLCPGWSIAKRATSLIIASAEPARRAGNRYSPSQCRTTTPL